MAGSINKVILVGNLGNDPEIKSMPNGGKVANLSVATSEQWKDKATGERKSRTEWHRVVIWDEYLLGFAERFLRKGSKVYTEGELQTRKWQDKNGHDRYATEIVLRKYKGQLIGLDAPGANEVSAHNQAKANGYQPDPARQEPLNDEIPF